VVRDHRMASLLLVVQAGLGLVEDPQLRVVEQ
jgi:hypothetical protein